MTANNKAAIKAALCVVVGCALPIAAGVAFGLVGFGGVLITYALMSFGTLLYFAFGGDVK